MKFVITITQVDAQPSDWTSFKSWPAPGIYRVKGDDSLYHVYKHRYGDAGGVDYISYGDLFMKESYQDPGESVSESLLLKVIAAASQAKVLTQ